MKKFMLFCFSLVVCFIMFCGFNTKASDVTLSMVNAASVRTDGTYQGLKFQAWPCSDGTEKTHKRSQVPEKFTFLI